MEKQLKVIVCNYSPTCNGNCEKCRYLTQVKIVDLATLKPDKTQGSIGCDCT